MKYRGLRVCCGLLSRSYKNCSSQSTPASQHTTRADPGRVAKTSYCSRFFFLSLLPLQNRFGQQVCPRAGSNKMTTSSIFEEKWSRSRPLTFQQQFFLRALQIYVHYFKASLFGKKDWHIWCRKFKS